MVNIISPCCYSTQLLPDFSSTISNVEIMLDDELSRLLQMMVIASDVLNISRDFEVSEYDETDNDYVPYDQRPETYIVPAVFSIILIVGVMGNSILVLILLCHANMRNVPNIYVLSLALGDLLVSMKRKTRPFSSRISVTLSPLTVTRSESYMMTIRCCSWSWPAFPSRLCSTRSNRGHGAYISASYPNAPRIFRSVCRYLLWQPWRLKGKYLTTVLSRVAQAESRNCYTRLDT